jgi:hypothetical protein
MLNFQILISKVHFSYIHETHESGNNVLFQKVDEKLEIY